MPSLKRAGYASRNETSPSSKNTKDRDLECRRWSCRGSRDRVRSPWGKDSLRDVSAPIDSNPSHAESKELETESIHRRTRRSTARSSLKSARLTKYEPTSARELSCRKVWILLQKTVDNLLGTIIKFQQGVPASHFKDGDLAARNGHMFIVQHVSVVFTEQAVVSAAAQGNLEMVKYLHRNRTEGATAQAMDLAATFGHLDVVQWLHINRREGCTSKAMDGAACNGHIDVRVQDILPSSLDPHILIRICLQLVSYVSYNNNNK